MDHRDVLVEPIVSEKSFALSETGQYTFRVHPSANKVQIRNAVEALFGVKVTNVNTLNRAGKRKRSRRVAGAFGTKTSQKRAIVTLAEGDTIDIFEG